MYPQYSQIGNQVGDGENMDNMRGCVPFELYSYKGDAYKTALRRCTFTTIELSYPLVPVCLSKVVTTILEKGVDDPYVIWEYAFQTIVDTTMFSVVSDIGTGNKKIPVIGYLEFDMCNKSVAYERAQAILSVLELASEGSGTTRFKAVIDACITMNPFIKSYIDWFHILDLHYAWSAAYRWNR
jgi:hypothetical protein